MKQHTRHLTQQIRAYFLVVVLFLAYAAKEMHHFTAHHHDEAVEICHAENEQHLHDYEHIAHDCDLCDFTFSFFTLDFPSFCFESQSTIDFAKTTFHYTAPFYSLSYQFAALRAPPVAA